MSAEASRRFQHGCRRGVSQPLDQERSMKESNITALRDVARGEREMFAEEEEKQAVFFTIRPITSGKAGRFLHNSIDR